MNIIFLQGWFIFTLTLILTLVGFILFAIIRDKIDTYKKKKKLDGDKK